MTTKYWQERIITHCTAGDTGGTTSPGHVPFGGSKLMIPYTTTRAPAYRPSMMRNFRAVKQPATIGCSKGFASEGMSPVLTSTPMTLPVKIGITQTQRVIARTAYVQQYIATCTYSGGLPLPCVSHVTL